MIIGDIKLSYPCIRYNVEVTHYTPRKSTAIEWLILEAISKVSKMDKYSGISVEDLFKHIFTISDSDLLIKPCLINLQDLGALTVSGLTDDTELSSIPMSDLSLTPKGEEMQKQGLLPGKDKPDNMVIYYDVISSHLFENVGNTYKEKPFGCEVIQLQDTDDVTFPSSKVRQLILDAQKEPHKRKYQWLQSTTQIRDLQSLDSKIMWKTVVKKLELGEGGLCKVQDAGDDAKISGLAFYDGVLPESADNSSLPEVIFDSPDEELKTLFFISEINGKLNENIKRDEKFVIDSNYWQDKMISNMSPKNLSVIIVSNAKEFKVELVGKSLRLQLTENVLPDKCVYLGNSELICAGLLRLHNPGGYKNLEVCYSPKSKSYNFASVIMDIVDRYYKNDSRILMLLPVVGLNELMLEYVEKVINECQDIAGKAELLENIDSVYFTLFNKKAGLGNMIQRVFVGNVLDNKTFGNSEDVCKLIGQICQVKIYKNDDVLLAAMLNGIFEKTTNLLDIAEVWAIWKKISEIKKSYISWIDKNGFNKNLYTKEVMKTLFSRFGKEHVFQIQEYTIAERVLINMSNLAVEILELLPDVKIGKVYSSETLLEMILQHKEIISDLKNNLKRWRDDLETICINIGDVSELADTKSQFSQFNKLIDQLMEASDIFLDEKAMKFSKVYVIDTTVLMNDASIISSFEDGEAMVIVPTVVLNELDGLKRSEDKGRAASARDAIRTISNYRAYEWFNCKENAHLELLPKDLDGDNEDNMILSVALKYFVKKPILLTDDINFSNVADSQNIASMDREAYLNSKRNEHICENKGYSKKKKKNRRG